MTTQIEPGAPGDPNNELSPAIEIDTAVLTTAWLTGPHPAALAEIEVTEEIEAPAVVPTRTESGDGSEDHVRMYLREIGTVPLLTWDGEKRLARSMESGVYLQDVIRPKAVDASVAALYRELYGRCVTVAPFVLSEARIDSPQSTVRDALLRAARRSDVEPDHLRSVAQHLETSLDETDRNLLEASILGHILPNEMLAWCTEHERDGCLPDMVVFETEFHAGRGRRGRPAAA